MAENPYVYMLVGVMGIIVLGHWFPSLKSINSTGCNSCGNINRLEQIPGIDLGTLAVCRQKGLV